MSALDLLYGPLFDALRGRRPVALLYFFVFVCPLQVKVWNASTGQCLHTATLEAAIISLSFHPSGRMIAMASSLYVYLWDYNVSIVVRGRCVVDRNLDVLRDSLQLSSLLEVRGEKRAVGSFIGLTTAAGTTITNGKVSLLSCGRHPRVARVCICVSFSSKGEDV